MLKHLDLILIYQNVNENLKREIEFIIKGNESVAEKIIRKTRLKNYC